MKQIAIIILLAVLVAGYFYLHGDSTPGTGDNGPPGGEHSVVARTEPIPVPTVATQRDEPMSFTLDRQRLYDVSYLVDPGLVAYAEAIDRTPECIVKTERGEASIDDRPLCTPVSAELHSLERPGEALKNLPLEQLLILADTDPKASIAVADFYYWQGDIQKQELYTERAVALSGKANPLFELTGDGGYELQYELILTAEALGRKIEAQIEQSAMNRLDAEQRASAEVRAQERVERLTALRQQLVGRPWGDQ